MMPFFPSELTSPKESCAFVVDGLKGSGGWGRRLRAKEFRTTFPRMLLNKRQTHLWEDQKEKGRAVFMKTEQLPCSPQCLLQFKYVRCSKEAFGPRSSGEWR